MSVATGHTLRTVCVLCLSRWQNDRNRPWSSRVESISRACLVAWYYDLRKLHYTLCIPFPMEESKTHTRTIPWSQTSCVILLQNIVQGAMPHADIQVNAIRNFLSHWGSLKQRLSFVCEVSGSLNHHNISHCMPCTWRQVFVKGTYVSRLNAMPVKLIPLKKYRSPFCWIVGCWPGNIDNAQDCVKQELLRMSIPFHCALHTAWRPPAGSYSGCSLKVMTPIGP